MDKAQIQSAIHYLYLKGLSATDIKKDMDQSLCESAPSYETVRFWVSEFKHGRTNVFDEERSSSGRPKEVTTPEMIKKYVIL